MTRKEQIKAVLDEYDNYDDFIIGGNISDEVIEKLAALPIDVPGDEEILMTESPHLETKSEAFGFRVGAKWMRDEIIKRNRP